MNSLSSNKKNSLSGNNGSQYEDYTFMTNTSAPTDDTIPVNNIKSELYGNDDLPYPTDDKKKGKNPKKKKIVISVIAAILGLLIGVGFFINWYKNYLFSQITIIETDENEQPTFIDEDGNTVNINDITETTKTPVIHDDGVSNFLLIGIDDRGTKYTKTGKGSRADVIMIMSVDKKAKTIKMMSVARDSYAFVPGYKGARKINAAMTYGGPELLKATLQNHLRIKIDGYAYVNFANMAKVIDACGGVRVDLTRAEAFDRGGINYHLKALYKENAPLVTSYGKNYWLNGKQAVAYARIRYIGDGDYERQRRQVEVLRGLLDEFMKMSTIKKAGVMDDILSCIVTSVPQKDIESYAFDFIPSMSKVEIQYIQLPIRGCFYSGMYTFSNGGKEWSMRPNWNGMIPYVQKFFYGKTTDFDPVKDIPKSPALSKCPKDIKIESLLK